MTDLSGRAHHEAGHALAFTLGGIGVEAVELTSYGACCHLASDTVPLGPYLAGLAAGWVAEAAHTGDRWGAYRHAADDRRIAHQVHAAQLGGAAPWEDLSQAADHLLTPRGETVARVADALLAAWTRGAHLVPARALPL